MELVKETRWSRHYSDELLGLKLVQSKFADGSAIITMDELNEKWHTWDSTEKKDFCHAVTEAKLEHLPEIYRFVMKFGDVDSWSAIAAWVVRTLPKEEVMPWIKMAALNCPVGRGEKLYQALTLTKSSEAVEILNKCLERAWRDPKLLRNEGYIDEPAMDAVVCMECILQLGETSPSLTEKYRVLSNHSIAVNRESAVSRLGSYFD